MRRAYICVDQTARVDLVDLGVKVGMRPEVAADDKVGEHLVDARVGFVLDHAKDVETGQDRFGELDVLAEGDSRVVASADRIRGGNDGTASLQSRDDAGFRDGDALLFHRFVDRSSVGTTTFSGRPRQFCR